MLPKRLVCIFPLRLVSSAPSSKTVNSDAFGQVATRLGRKNPSESGKTRDGELCDYRGGN
jgi:hypothetical protein